jgi:hypothetical protein
LTWIEGRKKERKRKITRYDFIDTQKEEKEGQKKEDKHHTHTHKNMIKV